MKFTISSTLALVALTQLACAAPTPTFDDKVSDFKFPKPHHHKPFFPTGTAGGVPFPTGTAVPIGFADVDAALTPQEKAAMIKAFAEIEEDYEKKHHHFHHTGFPVPTGSGFPFPSGFAKRAEHEKEKHHFHGFPFPTGTGFPFPTGTGGFPFPTGTGGFPIPTGTGFAFPKDFEKRAAA